MENTEKNKIEQLPLDDSSRNNLKNNDQHQDENNFQIEKEKPAKDKYEIEIVNEEYKKHIVKEDKDDDDDDEDDDKDDKEDKEDNEEKNDEEKKDKKKKKKKNKKKKKKDSDDEGKKDPNAPKKVIHTTLENPNIPESLRQKYSEYEKNPLCVAIGNIPLNSTVIELKGFFLTLISSLRPDISNPIRHIDIGSTNNFAILELDTKELATFCLTLDNLELQKYRLKVIVLLPLDNKIEKPKGFFNKVYDAEAQGLDPFGNISTNAQENEQKLYIGSIPLYLREEDIRKLCDSFGIVRYFNLVKDHEGGHKGYCFVEYTDPKCTDKALKHLDNLEIGDKRLRVSRVLNPAGSKPTQAMEPLEPGEDKPKPTNASGSFLMGFPNISDPNTQAMLNVPFACRTPSRVIQILNMCTADDLIDDEFYNDLYEDVKEEVNKFGSTIEIDIPRPDPKTGIAGPSVGKIFVKYQFLIPAKQARHRLTGRTYDRRTVIASFYPEDKFEAKEYLHSAF